MSVIIMFSRDALPKAAIMAMARMMPGNDMMASRTRWITKSTPPLTGVCNG